MALSGKLSVSEAESQLNHHHHHPEIWHSFKILERKGLIKRLRDRNPCKGIVLGKGRQKIYYALTEKGLFGFIATLADNKTKNANPKKFWRAIIGFCN